MKNDHTYCTAALSSLTYAMKAQRALESASIHSDIVKLDFSKSRRGCAYGVKFLCQYTPEVRAVMKENGIGVIKYLNGGGEIV